MTHRDPREFISDRALAAKWGVSARTARRAIRQLEKLGFPQRDPLFSNRRYLPAVEAFMARRANIAQAQTEAPPTVPIESLEDWDESPRDRRRRTRPQVAPAR